MFDSTIIILFLGGALVALLLFLARRLETGSHCDVWPDVHYEVIAEKHSDDPVIRTVLSKGLTASMIGEDTLADDWTDWEVAEAWHDWEQGETTGNVRLVWPD